MAHLARLSLRASVVWLAAGCSLALASSPVPPELTRQALQEPEVRATTIRDGQARIDELRVRGQTRSITVQPNRPGARSYQVVPVDGSRELSEGATDRRGSGGRRVWPVLSF